MLFKARITTAYRPKFIDETTAQFRDEMVVEIGDKKINTAFIYGLAHFLSTGITNGRC
jgi:hypothetical protein